MQTAKHNNPGKFTTEAVGTGHEYSKAVEGGFVRTKTTEPGILVSQFDRDLFLSFDDIRHAVMRAPQDVISEIRVLGIL